MIPMRSLRSVGIIGYAVVLLSASCAGNGLAGTAWGGGSFDSNGERIYFTATSDRGSEIDYEGGPGIGGMMMGGRLSCASCHGPDARGGTHRMHMDVMDAPNVRWQALTEAEEHVEPDEAEAGHDHDYTFDAFRAAVVDGVHADGQELSDDMPRWSITDADLGDLVDYLKSFESP